MYFMLPYPLSVASKKPPRLNDSADSRDLGRTNGALRKLAPALRAAVPYLARSRCCAGRHAESCAHGGEDAATGDGEEAPEHALDEWRDDLRGQRSLAGRAAQVGEK